MVVPYFDRFGEASRRLSQAGVKLVAKAGTTIGDLVKQKEKRQELKMALFIGCRVEVVKNLISEKQVGASKREILNTDAI